MPAAPSSPRAWSTCARGSASRATSTKGLLESELAAAVAGGVTGLVCPPDTRPVLDEPGLVEMLKFRTRNLDLARVFPLGALTRGLAGEALTEMAELSEAGCVGLGQGDAVLRDTLVLHRALQYAATFGLSTWLRPNDAWLGGGVAAKGPLATRMGLTGVPVLAETIALATIFELVRDTGARVHLCRLSSAAGVELVRRAKAEGLPVSCDASIHQLHLIDVDIGYFDAPCGWCRRCASSATATRSAPASPTARSTRWSATTRRSPRTRSTCRSPKPRPARPGSSCCSAWC
jgi:dihydroorotase-like cyclic amidohydrolase